MVERLTLPYLPILIGVKHLTIPNCPYCGKELTLPNLGGAAYLANFTYIIIIAGTAANLARLILPVLWVEPPTMPNSLIWQVELLTLSNSVSCGRAAYLAQFAYIAVERLTLPNPAVGYC